VSSITLEFERAFDLPASIVWDALIDPVLLEGWLADATVDPRVGGEYRLAWIAPTHLVPVAGRIVALVEGSLLEISTGGPDRLRFALVDVPGGTRGSATSVRVVVTTALEPRFAPGVIAHWRSNLEQLEELLRGHPVDWANWERDRGVSWGQHLERAHRENLL